MGMYTEIAFNADIRADAPKEVIDALRYMVGEIESFDSVPKHEFFETHRWAFLPQGASYYFDGCTTCRMERTPEHDDIMLSFRSNIKNNGSEIELFLDWIGPYVRTEGHVGYTRYEEDFYPKMLFAKNGEIRSVELMPKPEQLWIARLPE